jgi:hypothetical protein
MVLRASVLVEHAASLQLVETGGPTFSLVKIGMARIARLDHLLEIPAGDGGRLGGLLRSRRLCARADKHPTDRFTETLAANTSIY